MQRPPAASIFLPRQELHTESAGFLVGFNPDSFLCTIVTIVKGVPLATLEDSLAALAADPAVQPLIEHCGGAPSVLGAYLPRGMDADLWPLAAGDRASVAELWLTLVGTVTSDRTHSRAVAALREVHCCGCRHHAPMQLFLYRRGSSSADAWRSQHTLQHPWKDVLTEGAQTLGSNARDLRVDPNRLKGVANLQHFSDDAGASSGRAMGGGISSGFSSGISSGAQRGFNRVSCAPDLSGSSDATSRGQQSVAGPNELDMTLRHVSCSGELEAALRSILPPASQPRPAVLARLAQPLCTATLFASNFLLHRVGWPAIRLCWFASGAPLLLALRMVAGAWLWLLRFEPIPGVAWRLGSYSARLLEVRLLRAVEWPHRWRSMVRLSPWHPGAVVERTHTYSELACALLDAALGVVLAFGLISSRAEICDFVGEVHTLVHETWLPGRVRWLMGVDPGGFKLNEPLNVALGTCVLALLRTWHATVTLLLSILPPPQSLLLFLVPGCCLGASISVAIISDVLSLSCFHLRQLHRAIAYVYGGYCAALYSLFNLFRGAKYNVLRKRVDHCDYDMEQRLLGTLFFTGTGAARMSTSLDVACQLFIQSGTPVWTSVSMLPFFALPR